LIIFRLVIRLIRLVIIEAKYTSFALKYSFIHLYTIIFQRIIEI